MKPIITVTVVIIATFVLGTVGFDSYDEYREKWDLNNSIVSCMEQYGKQTNQWADCINDDYSVIP